MFMSSNDTTRIDQLHVFLDSNSLDQADPSKQDQTSHCIQW